MEHTPDQSRDVMTPRHQSSEIVSSGTPPPLAAPPPASTHAGTPSPGFAALASLEFILPPETQQALANLDQHLRQVFAPLATLRAAWHQAMEPLVRIGKPLAHLDQRLRQAFAPLATMGAALQRQIAPLHGIGQQLAQPWRELEIAKQRMAFDWRPLVAPLSPDVVELKKVLSLHEQKLQAGRREIAGDMQARPDYYSDLEDLLTLLRLQANPQAWESPEARETTCQAAIHRLAARLPLGLADRAANAALRRMVRERDVPREALLREWLFPAGVLLAAMTMREPRYIRLGKHWVTDESGRKQLIAPVHLLPYQARQWLFQEVRNAAEASLLNRAYPPRAPEVLDNALPLLDAEPGPAAWGLFLPPESRVESEGLFEHLVRVASPREREVLALSLSGCDDAEIAATLGIKPGTVRVFRHRLKKRFVRLLSA